MRHSRVGAHIAVAGGLRKAAARIEDVGAETVQVFLGNPRGWALPAPDPDGDAEFGAWCAGRGVQVFVHAPYLINFGSPSPETLANSTRALEFALRRGAAVGALGVVVHAGSAVLGNRWEAAMAQVRSCVLPLLDGPGPDLLIEPTAGGGGALAASASSLAAYLSALGAHERIGVCIDTCHMHAAGHDLGSARGFAAAVRSFAAVGRIGLVHVNDSRDPVGSLRDRHASVGEGTIGLAPFKALFGPALRGVPMVVECPPAEQAKDIATLKTLRG